VPFLVFAHAAAELLAVLIQRFSATRDSLSPRQVVAVLWAAYKVGRWLPRVISIGVRHLTANLANYQTVDLVGMMWACGQLKGMIPGEGFAAVHIWGSVLREQYISGAVHA
jgi:predicted membrane protein